MNDMKKRLQKPEGALIEAALKQAPATSMRKLAEHIGMSEGRVRQIINGYRTEGGQVLEIKGPTDTVARMAEAAGVTPDDMAKAGRLDVADEMRQIKSLGITESGNLWLSTNEQEVAELREWLDSLEGDPHAKPPTRPLLLWDFEQLMQAADAKHRDELRLKDYFIELFGRGQSSTPTLAVVPDPETTGGDGNADATGGSAPTSEGGLYEDQAAYDPEKD